ncbi:lipopolysaccharide biosynthesis protein [Rhodococcus fascians]|nr:lipopolysaccharide biosynthesis protein [Rhodococcus fascians]MBY4430438.1 lipopolysaccharide biosynthesis protein [Rhodococcus fascians]
MKHRARRVPPPDHGRLDKITYYPVEQVRWDMGFNSRTVPFHAVPPESAVVAAHTSGQLSAADSIPDGDPMFTAAEASGTAVAGSKPAGRNLALNSFAMMFSTIATGGLGLAFWAVAGRLFPVEEVGSASAVIASAVMIATLSNLSLGSMYERFLPTAGVRAKSYVLRGYAAVLSLALILGCAFLVVAPVDELFTTTTEIATFPIFVGVLAVFALQDQTSSGLGFARWAAAKNVFHAVVKLAVLALTYETGRSFTIIAAWAVPAAIAAIVLFRAFGKKLGSDPRYQLAPSLPPRKELWSYFGSAYGITALGTMAPLMIPIIVVSTLGPEQNAYFSLTWSIVSAIYVLIGVLVGPFVAEAAAHPEQFSRLAKRFIGLLCIVAIGGSFFLAVVAPFGLGIVGPDYRENGTIIVHLAAVTIPLSVVGALYDGLARVRRRMRLAVLVQIAATIIIVTGSLTLSPSLGIAGIGWSYLAAEAFGAVVLLVPLIRWIGDLSGGGDAEHTEPAVDPRDESAAPAHGREHSVRA